MNAIRALKEIDLEAFVTIMANAYPGINAATTALWLGQRKKSQQFAQAVLALLENRAASLAGSQRLKSLRHNYWEDVTRAEALLLLDNLPAAQAMYLQTFREHAHEEDNIRVSREQAIDILQTLGYPNPEDLLRLGQTIVYDIYPSEQGGGYFFDFTRTWSLGYATPEAQELYDQVFDVYHAVVENMDLNSPFRDYQKLTCEEFEKYGHATTKNGATPQEGYIHSLGHGLGINVHERPFSGITAGDDERLVPGVVVTVEPGLYYPSKGMGFRIEDSYWVRPDGKIELLAEYPYDFVLEMKKWKN